MGVVIMIAQVLSVKLGNSETLVPIIEVHEKLEPPYDRTLKVVSKLSKGIRSIDIISSRLFSSDVYTMLVEVVDIYNDHYYYMVTSDLQVTPIYDSKDYYKKFGLMSLNFFDKGTPVS